MKVQSPKSKVQSPKAVPPPLWWIVLTVAVVVVALVELFWHGGKRAASRTNSMTMSTVSEKSTRRFDFTPGRAQPAKAAEAIVAEKVLKFGQSRRRIAERIAKRRK